MKTKLILATAGLIAGLGFALPLQAGTLDWLDATGTDIREV